jgi:hypothetical protein
MKHLYLCPGAQRHWYRWLKLRAHRLNRREWRSYLHCWAALGGDERAERRLDMPKADARDVI